MVTTERYAHEQEIKRLKAVNKYLAAACKDYMDLSQELKRENEKLHEHNYLLIKEK
ncbi:MAG TPA: hypothetical protein VIK34_05945 [Clostridiaceae bacterium]